MEFLLKVVHSKMFFNVVVSLIIILIAMIVWSIFKRAYNTHVKKKLLNQELAGNLGTVTTLFYDIFKVIVILITVLLVLQINGINVSSLFAGLGIASAVIGLALQDFLKDVIMGIHIMTDDFFRIGDVISFQGTEGVVISYNLRTTKIKGILSEGIITICNRNISVVEKCSGINDLNIALSYEEDIKHVMEVLKNAGSKISEIEGVEGYEYRGIQEYSDSALIHRIRYNCPPDKKLSTRRNVLTKLYEILQEEEIFIPYNQMDVHLDGISIK
ncbi:MAG: mechanosensitive ion channel family protein [Lachnospiraceae bacterium]|nr:mechanosensitive ion channel family protein [Lachnospiraceae bacterium]